MQIQLINNIFRWQTLHSEEIGPAAEHVRESGFLVRKSVDDILASAPAAASLTDAASISRRASLISYKKSGRAEEEAAVARELLREGLNGYFRQLFLSNQFL